MLTPALLLSQKPTNVLTITKVLRRNFVSSMRSPIVLGALHREWVPGSHTTLLGGRLHSDVQASDNAAVLDFRTNQVRLASFHSSRDTSEFTAWVAELNQVWQTERHVTIAGARFQSGSFDVGSVIDGASSTNSSNYYAPPILTALDEPFQRWSLYGYETVEVVPSLRLTNGAGLRCPPPTPSRPSAGNLPSYAPAPNTCHHAPAGKGRPPPDGDQAE